MSATSTWTSTSPSASGSGRGTSSSRRSPGPWKISALIQPGRERCQPSAGRRGSWHEHHLQHRPLPEQREPSSNRSSGSTVGSGSSSSGRSATACFHVRRRRRPRADHRQLAPVDARRRAGCRASAKSSTVPPGSTAASAVSRAAGGAEDGGIDRPVGRAPARAGLRVDREDRVSAPLQHRPEEPPDEAVADDRARARAGRAPPRGARTRAARRTCRGRRRPVRQLDPAVARGPARRSRRARSSARGSARTSTRVPRGSGCTRRSSGDGSARRAARPPCGRRPRARARCPARASPIFSTSEPQSPQARTSTSAGLAASSISRRRGCRSASRTAARTGVS